jgi:hypothetical protein
MNYLYSFANASLTLRVVEYLQQHRSLSLSFMTVIHQINGWVVRVNFSRPLDIDQHGDFQAFLSELGIPYEPTMRVQMALWGLETGQSPVEVPHGCPDRPEIEAFRSQFVQGLGYCPETLA